jgi:DNA invertase Pin-like site-specific DNA recombinase
MGKRAVIYVRTSSEQQAEKCSPVEQESDCRQFAEQQGLVVVNVYRDIDRYRVKNKWVEPSGTRYDRPGLLAMLRDAEDDQFDVIIAWREDRLYRGMRAMLLVLEAIQQYKLSILLARETFDPATAPLKAWLAQMELEHIKERMTMGVKARLRAGKANSGQDRYGYRRNGDVIEIVPEEAEWVRQIFAWYNQGLNKKEMRKRLIAANAPQKNVSRPRRITWATSSIEGILNSAKEYANGIKVQRREGDRFELVVEPLIGMKTYEQFLQVRRKLVKHSFPELKDYYLARSLLVCACGYKWQQHSGTSHYRNQRGEWVEKKVIKGFYFCPADYEELISPDCPRKISRQEADREVWRQVSNVINNPEILIAQARHMVEELKYDVTSSTGDQERIGKELENIAYSRQFIITQARKGGITEEEMDQRLNELSLMEVQLKRELTSMRDVIDIRLLADWDAKVEEYLADLQCGIQGLDVDAQETDWLETFSLKRKIVQMLVEKVHVDHNKQLTVIIRLDLLGILGSDEGNSNHGGGDLAGHGFNHICDPKENRQRKNSLLKSNIGYVRVTAP